MKLLFVLFVLTFVAISTARPKENPEDCYYVVGVCVGYCEKGTHSYSPGCGSIMPEATCDEPNPEKDNTFNVCDFSACYCNSPTVRDTISGKCVNLDECPKKPEPSTF